METSDATGCVAWYHAVSACAGKRPTLSSHDAVGHRMQFFRVIVPLKRADGSRRLEELSCTVSGRNVEPSPAGGTRSVVTAGAGFAGDVGVGAGATMFVVMINP
jgi:hypothetical protein